MSEKYSRSQKWENANFDTCFNVNLTCLDGAHVAHIGLTNLIRLGIFCGGRVGILKLKCPAGINMILTRKWNWSHFWEWRFVAFGEIITLSHEENAYGDMRMEVFLRFSLQNEWAQHKEKRPGAWMPFEQKITSSAFFLEKQTISTVWDEKPNFAALILQMTVEYCRQRQLLLIARMRWNQLA